MAYRLFGADPSTGALPPVVRGWIQGLISAAFSDLVAAAIASGTLAPGIPSGALAGISLGYDGGDLNGTTTPTSLSGGYDGGNLNDTATPTVVGYDGGVL